MPTIPSDQVRIPRAAREAIARHEHVVVLNRERPAYLIVHPDDLAAVSGRRRGRTLGEALAMLAQAAQPDAAFADDLELVLDSVGSGPEDPWERS